MKIPISKLHPNIGQIEGLPKNPRLIADAKFALLKKSIQDDPEMLALRELLVFPFEKDYVIIGGNMRLLALTELGYTDADCKVIDPETPVEKLRAYVIKDNMEYGMTDWDALEEDWDIGELKEWGVDIFDNDIENETSSKDISDKIEEKFIIEIEVENESDQEKLYNEMKKKGYLCRILTL